MLIKYYYDGKSRRYNDMFYSPTNCSTYTIPYVKEDIRRILDEYRIELNLSGFKQVLYLEKPENTNRYWKAVIAIWDSGDSYMMDFEPERVVRVTFDNFSSLVKDRFTNEYVEELPLKVYYKFLESGYSSFY